MLKNLLFGSQIKNPIFIKDFSYDNPNLLNIKNLIENSTNENYKKTLELEYNLLKQGLDGENTISYELKNSFLPMLILHDIRLDDGEYSAQMDYILITTYFIMILETKKLVGDININNSGDFTRLFKSNSGKVYKKEGIYSPVVQNDRHVRILTKILKDNKLIKNLPILSCIVIANPKSIVNKFYAPKDIKNKIIKYDQLTTHLKGLYESYRKSNNICMIDKRLYSIAEFLKENNTPKINDYSYLKPSNNQNNTESKETKNSLKANTNISIELESKLKKYRMKKAIENKVPPYCIFTDETLRQLIQFMPLTLDELYKIKGLGKVKISKYGTDILNIFTTK